MAHLHQTAIVRVDAVREVIRDSAGNQVAGADVLSVSVERVRLSRVRVEHLVVARSWVGSGHGRYDRQHPKAAHVCDVHHVVWGDRHRRRSGQPHARRQPLSVVVARARRRPPTAVAASLTSAVRPVAVATHVRPDLAVRVDGPHATRAVRSALHHVQLAVGSERQMLRWTEDCVDRRAPAQAVGVVAG